MAENNATCSICGKEYYACLSCRDSLKANPWKVHTDTAEHYKVYQIIHGISTGVYTRDEAKEKFKNVDLSDLNGFRPHIKKIIKDILKENKSVVKPIVEVDEIVELKVAPEENIIENTVVEDVVKVKEPENIVKPTYTRKKNYKVEVE